MEKDKKQEAASPDLTKQAAPEASGDGLLDESLFKLLAFQREQGMDNHAMLATLSLVNLLGIVNFMNKRAAGTAANPMLGGGADPLMGLLSMLASGGGPRGGGGNSKMPFDPSLLLGLLSAMGGPGGSGGSSGGINPANLMGLLASMMGPPPEQPRPASSPAPVEVKKKDDQIQQPEPVATGEEKSRDNLKKNVIKWDSRLG